MSEISCAVVDPERVQSWATSVTKNRNDNTVSAKVDLGGAKMPSSIMIFAGSRPNRALCASIW